MALAEKLAICITRPMLPRGINLNLFFLIDLCCRTHALYLMSQVNTVTEKGIRFNSRK